jgi:uncharacterized membrane protein (DUF2068 family)
MSARLQGHRRHETAWELVVCGWRGHVLPAADAAELRPHDWALGLERDGVRWSRCLRCDTWIPAAIPADPVRHHPPERDAIEIPARGQALRDKIVLRLIAIDRLLHFLILVSLGIAVLVLSRHQQAAHNEFDRVLTAIQGGVAGGPVQTTGRVGIIRELDKLFSLRAHTLRTVGIALLAYGILEGVEAVGLWLLKRWAEYLTFIATTILLPFEVYELTNRVSALKIIGFLINLAVVVYLVWAKRLFGLRGGGAVDERRREAAMSWETIERSVPAPLRGGASVSLEA